MHKQTSLPFSRNYLGGNFSLCCYCYYREVRNAPETHQVQFAHDRKVVSAVVPLQGLSFIALWKPWSTFLLPEKQMLPKLSCCSMWNL